MLRHARIGGTLLVAGLFGCEFQTQPPEICSLGIQDTIYADSSRPARLGGTLSCNTAPLATSWSILKGTQDVSSGFRLEWTEPGPGDLSWNLEKQAHALLRVVSAVPDSYTLVATLVDGDGVTYRRKLGFRVFAPPFSAFGIDSLRLKGTLSTDTSAGSIELSGKLLSAHPPLSLRWKVVHGDADVSSRFRLDWTAPASDAQSWDLATQAKARLRNLSAPADTYELVAILADARGKADTARAGLRVEQACGGGNCDVPFPMSISFTGIGAQSQYYSALSLLSERADNLVSPFLPTDSLDLVVLSIDGTLQLLSPVAAARLDTSVARWPVRNPTVIVAAPTSFPTAPTLREVMAGVGNSTSQSQVAQQGRTYLLKLAGGAFGWIRLNSIQGKADSSSLSITFAVSR